MKTPNDPRHKNRIIQVEQLFAHSFRKKTNRSKITPILSHLDSIDEIIQKHAPEWPIDQLSRLDLAVLRLAIYELEYEKQTPSKVVVDEAVEIAKSYGNENSAKFVNGVLGSIIK